MAKDKKERLIIIDGNALIHRSFHALPPTMATKKGEVVNAVYGFTTVLLKAIREFKPNFVALTLDKKAPTFRHVEYKEYKAHRVKAPDELYAQIPRVKEIANAFSIPIFEKDGFEADDLIGTITKKTDHRVEKIILTGDMDTLQLVDADTKVYTMSRGLSDSVIYDEKAVKDRFGLRPDQMIDYKALRGDPSDNIPGVRGIGEKTATDLLREFKTLDGVYKEVESQKTHKAESRIKPRIIDLLKQYKENAFLSKKLATIMREAPIDFNLEEARFGKLNKEEIVKLFSELEFRSLLPRIQELDLNIEKSKDSKAQECVVNKFERNKKLFNYILIDDDKKFKTFFAKLKKQKKFVFDTETSSFDPITSELLGISFSWKEEEAYFVQVQSQKFKVKSNFDLFNYKDKKSETIVCINEKWLKQLRPVFDNEKIKKCGHNIKFDIRVMKASGIEVKGADFDTMIASYLLNPGTRQHNLDALTFSELGFEKISKEDLLGKGKDKKSFSELEMEKLSLYSCEDADFTNRLRKKLEGPLKKERLDKLFNEIEMPLAGVLASMEDSGIKIDVKFLGKLNKEAAGKIKKLEEKIIKIAGVNFNINSTQQLREVLFERLEIPTAEVGKTKTGFSTSAEELAKLKDLHPIIKFIQEYREINKLSNTYINALPELVNKKTGRLHTSFNQTITATGRLSSSEPNLQNIPIRTELGREIRKAFLAEKGYKLASFDYSQIELRLAAHMSGDKKMVKAFLDGADIHTATAAEINGVEFEKVTYAMRREAKAINFGILYGQGPHGLSQTADIPYGRAKEYIENYFKVYTGIKKFIETTIQKARDKGYAETTFGRKRFLPEINSSVLQARKAAERMAINTPLQGTAADIIKKAMIEINSLIKNSYEEDEIRMLLQVHDELVFEIKENKIKEIAGKIEKIMANVLKLKVPVEVDVEMGDNWGEMNEI